MSRFCSSTVAHRSAAAPAGRRSRAPRRTRRFALPDEARLASEAPGRGHACDRCRRDHHAVARAPCSPKPSRLKLAGFADALPDRSYGAWSDLLGFLPPGRQSYVNAGTFAVGWELGATLMENIRLGLQRVDLSKSMYGTEPTPQYPLYFLDQDVLNAYIVSHVPAEDVHVMEHRLAPHPPFPAASNCETSRTSSASTRTASSLSSSIMRAKSRGFRRFNRRVLEAPAAPPTRRRRANPRPPKDVAAAYAPRNPCADRAEAILCDVVCRLAAERRPERPCVSHCALTFLCNPSPNAERQQGHKIGIPVRLRRRRFEVLATTRRGGARRPRIRAQPITAEQRFDRLFLIVHGHGGVLDELDIPVPAGGTLPVTDLRLMLTTASARRSSSIASSSRSDSVASTMQHLMPRPTVSIVVCTRDLPSTCAAGSTLLRCGCPRRVRGRRQRFARRRHGTRSAPRSPVRYVREPQL